MEKLEKLKSDIQEVHPQLTLAQIETIIALVCDVAETVCPALTGK